MFWKRIVIWNVPICQLLMEIWDEAGLAVGFGVVLGLVDIWHMMYLGELGKKNTPIMVAAVIPFFHGAPLLAPLHTTISQHASWQVFVVKTRQYNWLYYLFATCGVAHANVAHKVTSLTFSLRIFSTSFYIRWAQGNATTATTHKNCQKHQHHGGWATCPSSNTNVMDPHNLMCWQPIQGVGWGRGRRITVENCQLN